MNSRPTHVVLRPGFSRARAHTWGSEAAAIVALSEQRNPPVQRAATVRERSFSSDRVHPSQTYPNLVVVEDPRFGRLDVPHVRRAVPPMGEPVLLRSGATTSSVRMLWADDPRKLGWKGTDTATSLGRPSGPVLTPRGQLGVYTEADAQSWSAAGLPESQIRLVDPPPIDAGPWQRPIEIDLEPDENPSVVVALGDHPMHIDARVFLYQLTVCESAGRAVVGVLPRGAHHAATARRQCAKMHHAPRLVEAAIPSWRLLAEAAVGVLFAGADEPTGADRIIASCAHNLGVPLVRLGPTVTRTQRTARALVDPILKAVG